MKGTITVQLFGTMTGESVQDVAEKIAHLLDETGMDYSIRAGAK